MMLSRYLSYYYNTVILLCRRSARSFFVAWLVIFPQISIAELPVACGGGNCSNGINTWVGYGSATQQIIGNHLQVNQLSDRAILNWQSFNIGANNSVNFNQPSQTSVALNRIFQNDPSLILGSLSAIGID